MAACLEEDSFYQCSICFEDMTERKPRLLACHHSFCEQCLRKMVKNGNIECPTCRQLTAVTKNDVTALIMNFMILAMKERENKFLSTPRKVILCHSCYIKIAAHLFYCTKLICQTPSTQHSRSVRFKNHVLGPSAKLNTKS